MPEDRPTNRGSRLRSLAGKAAGGIWSAFAAPLVLLGLVAWQGPAIQDWVEPPRCDDPDSLAVLGTSGTDGDEITVAADTTLATRPGFPEGYAADHLLDGDYRTAWIEGDAEGPGIHQKLVFTFAAPRDVQMICLVNGWARSSDFFKRNGRVRILEVSTDGGTVRASLDDKALEEFTGYQQIELARGTTRTVTFEILAVNAPYGTEDADVIDEDDTAISEVEFWTSG